MNPLVSIIIPSYNRFEWLQDAIQSVKKQTYSHIEIIVVNDNSTDPKYLKLDKSINQINLNHNNCSRSKFGKPCGAYCRNIGIKKSKGEYICFLDDDDYWLPEKVEKQLKVMKDRKYNFSMTNSFIMDPRIVYQNFKVKEYINNNNTSYCYPKNLMKGIDNKLPEVWNSDFFKDKNHGTTSSCMIKRNIIKEIGFMTEVPNWGQYQGVYQDWDYWKRISKKYNCLYLSEPLVVWYKHKRGLTKIDNK